MSREVLHIGVGEAGGTRVLRLTGELDAFTSDRLFGITRTWVPGAAKIIVNLDELEYIDSAGLSALVNLWVQARDNGVQMLVSCQSPRIQRVLQVTGLVNLFTLVGSDAAAKVMQSTGYQDEKITSVGGSAVHTGLVPRSGSLRVR